MQARAHYVGLGKCCELPCYGRSGEIAGNDEYIQFPQKDAMKNIKIMCRYLLKRKMLSKRRCLSFGYLDLHFSSLASVLTM